MTSNGAAPPKPSMRVTGWVAINSGALIGKCTVELSLMRIVGVMIMRGNDGNLWASLPSRPRIDRDGKVMIHTATGKRMYEAVMEWRSKEIAERFSRAVIALLRATPLVDLGDSPGSRPVDHGLQPGAADTP